LEAREVLEDDRRFLGRGWGFPPAFDLQSGGVKMVVEEEDIEESLLILFSTSPGERLMLPEYGCDLRDHVFDSVDNTTLTHLKGLIADAVLFFEPRIRLEEVEIDSRKIVEGTLFILLQYTVLSTNSRSNMVIPFYLTEGTNVRVV
jgi:phage baseplate assembly protein W